VADILCLLCFFVGSTNLATLTLALRRWLRVYPSVYAPKLSAQALGRTWCVFKVRDVVLAHFFTFAMNTSGLLLTRLFADS
jgi:hypothetical protein